MKTLSKLTIKNEKVLNNDELKQLKGGWYGYCWIYYYVGVDLEYYSSNWENWPYSTGEAEADCEFEHAPCDCVCTEIY